MLEYWMDFLFYTLLVIGFIFSILLQSSFLSYVVIILFGLMAGRLIFYFGKKFPLYVILLGFLLGFILGSRFADWKLLVLLFFLGSAMGYYIHAQGLLEHKKSRK